MDELEAIRLRVQQLLARGKRSDLSDEERKSISNEVNQLWSQLASSSQPQRSREEATT
jgi:hypothetical protein